MARSSALMQFLMNHRESLGSWLMAVAALLTAWCAFEATKWGGVQAIQLTEALAARTESTRDSLLDHQLAQVDVSTFLAWIQALEMENPGRLDPHRGPYVPDPELASGFLFERLRPEFLPAVEAWLATRPLRNPDAPRTPFAMEAYQRPLAQRSAEMLMRAERDTKAALRANSVSDNYTLVTVFSSLVIFCAGLSNRMQRPASGVMLLLLAFGAFLVCLVALFTLPVLVFRG